MTQWFGCFMTKKVLIILLVFGGALQSLALIPIFFPFAWMAYWHALMDIGELPQAIIVGYLTRSLSMLYATYGILYLYLALHVDRYLPLIRFMAWLKIVLGAGLAILDLYEGMPWYWTLAEGPGIIAFSILLIVVTHQRERELKAMPQ